MADQSWLPQQTGLSVIRESEYEMRCRISCFRYAWYFYKFWLLLRRCPLCKGMLLSILISTPAPEPQSQPLDDREIPHWSHVSSYTYLR